MTRPQAWHSCYVFFSLSVLVFAFHQIKPVGITRVLVKPFAPIQFQFLFFKLLSFCFVIGKRFSVIAKHGQLKLHHFNLKLKVFNCLLMTTAHNVCIVQISRRLQVLIETFLNVRMIDVPFFLCGQFDFV